MVRKKLSGQTITIIILAILLLISLVFGVVFAFYSARTNVVSGKIVMANLNIELKSIDADNSEASAIVISNGTNVVPNEMLENSPLIVTNKSSVPIYLMVCYELKAFKGENETPVKDNYNKAVIDIDCNYINPSKNIYNVNKNTPWVDYVFTSSQSGETKQYRCFVSTAIYATDSTGEQEIVVIPQNGLKLSRDMGNDYQSSTIAFTFQAFAVAADSFNFSSTSTTAYKCEQIVSSIYEFQGYTLLTY